MDKSILRVKYKDIRNSVFDKKLKSEIITNKIINSDIYKKARNIALYCSFSSEVDTHLLIEKSLLDNKNVFLPRVIDDEHMEFYKISSMEDLNWISGFGIKEPAINKSNTILSDTFDLVIVPGICFDVDKNRIGFGKGYYDRYFKNLDNVFKIGICFDEQVLKDDMIECNDNDIKMDIVITDLNNY